MDRAKVERFKGPADLFAVRTWSACFGWNDLQPTDARDFLDKGVFNIVIDRCQRLLTGR